MPRYPGMTGHVSGARISHVYGHRSDGRLCRCIAPFTKKSSTQRCYRSCIQRSKRGVQVSVGAVSSHESATLWGGGGHFWGRIARLATRQGLLGLSSRRVQAFGLKGLGLRVHGLGFKIGVMPEAHRGAHAARCTRRDARAVTLCTPRTCQEQLPHVLPLLRFSL
jgi:hypothetical protein